MREREKERDRERPPTHMFPLQTADPLSLFFDKTQSPWKFPLKNYQSTEKHSHWLHSPWSLQLHYQRWIERNRSDKSPHIANEYPFENRPDHQIVCHKNASSWQCCRWLRFCPTGWLVRIVLSTFIVWKFRMAFRGPQSVQGDFSKSNRLVAANGIGFIRINRRTGKRNHQIKNQLKMSFVIESIGLNWNFQ